MSAPPPLLLSPMGWRTRQLSPASGAPGRQWPVTYGASTLTLLSISLCRAVSLAVVASVALRHASDRNS